MVNQHDAGLEFSLERTEVAEDLSDLVGAVLIGGTGPHQRIEEQELGLQGAPESLPGAPDPRGPLVLDEQDAAQRAGIEALGLRVSVVDMLMRTPEVAANVARTALDLSLSV